MKILPVLSLSLISFAVSAQVGIGTTSPTVPLDIEATNAAIDINNTSTDPLIHFQVSGTTNFTIGTDITDSKFKIGTTALETGTALTVESDGSVGVGITSPQGLFNVDGGNSFFTNGDIRIDEDGDGDLAGIGEVSGGLALSSSGDAASNIHLFIENTTGDVGIGTTSPVSGLDVQTSMGLSVTTITSATTLDNTHNVVLCNTGAYTVTLPAAASHTGKVYYIKNIDAESDDITIDGNGSEEIDGATTVVLYVRYDAVRIVSDGTDWHIIADERIPHKCILSRDATQAITTSSSTEISFDNEVLDVGGLGATGTGNSVTIQRAGEYTVTADWSFQYGDANNYMRAYIYVNGALARMWQSRNVSANSLCTAGLTYTATFAAADYIDMYVMHNEGTTENTEAAVDERPRMSVVEIR